jgi:hypothetical protein
MSRHLQISRILWFALLMASVIYPAILLFLLQNDGLPAQPGPPAMVLPLYVVALLTATMSFVMPRLGLSQTLAPLASRLGTESSSAGQAPWPGYRAPAASERVLRLTDGDRRQLVNLLRPRLIIALALSESVSLLGFVLGFLGHPLGLWAPLSAAGTLLIASRFPTARWALGAAERAHGVRAVLVDA